MKAFPTVFIVLNPANPRQTGLEDTADAFVAAAKNSSMTGQNIQIGEGNIILDYASD